MISYWIEATIKRVKGKFFCTFGHCTPSTWMIRDPNTGVTNIETRCYYCHLEMDTDSDEGRDTSGSY